MTPEGWARASLETLLADETPGFWGEPVTDPADYGKVAVLRSTNLHNDGSLDLDDIAWRSFPARKLAEKKLQRGDILLERSGGGPKQPVGRVAYFDADGTYSLSNFMQRLRPDRSMCDARFLAYELWHFHQSGGTETLQQATTGIRNLQYRGYLDRAILVPPLAEQRKIAAVLSSVDAAISSTQAVVSQLQVLKKTMVVELLTRGLPGRHTRFKQAECGEVPEDWDATPLGDLAVVDTGFAFKSADFCEGGEATWPVVRMSDMRGGRLELSKAVHVRSETVRNLDRFRLAAGDVLIGLSGSLGNYALVRRSDADAYLNQRVGRIRVLHGHPAFVLAWYLSRPVQEAIRRLAAGGAQANISPSQIRSLVIPRPSAAEEAMIAAAFESIDERLWREAEALGRLVSLKAVLLSALLCGEVRVTPDEESA